MQPDFKLNQRVHWTGDYRRIGTVKYIGTVQGYSGDWIGIEWDNRDGKHDGSVNGVRYFTAQFPNSASFARPHNLTTGVTLLQALDLRYRTDSTKEELDEMYVLSSSKKRVNVELVGKDKIEDILGRFDELPGASLSYLGVSSPGDPQQISKTIPCLKELDLTGNLLSTWQDVDAICSGLPALTALNLTNNLMSSDVVRVSHLKNLRLLVLNNVAINWSQVEVLKDSLQVIEELHLMGNKIREITPASSDIVQGFDSLRVLNLEDNYIADWGEILKLSRLKWDFILVAKGKCFDGWKCETCNISQPHLHCHKDILCLSCEHIHGMLRSGMQESNSSAEPILRSRAMIIVLSEDNLRRSIDESGIKAMISAIEERLSKLESRDAKECECALETLGQIGSSTQGAVLLLTNKDVARLIVNAAFDLHGHGKQLAVLHSLGNILGETRPENNKLLTH